MSGEGLVYPFDAGPLKLEVLVALNQDGHGWRVRFDVGGSQYTGNGASPVTAFQIAAQLTREQLVAQRGMSLDIETIERELVACDALASDIKITLTASQQAAVGFVAKYPAQLDPTTVEGTLRAADFIGRTQGIRSPHWHVEAALWKDFGRELLVCVHLGAV
jgi:hypothetical protein